MLLRNPQPDPEFSRRFGMPTEIEIPAMPKQQEWRRKQPTMEFPAIPKQQEWTPPPYWRELLHVQETKFERRCKEWFVKALLVLGSLGFLALVSIYLFKLLMMVAMQ